MCFRAESLIFDMNSISIRALFIDNCCKGDLNATEITNQYFKRPFTYCIVRLLDQQTVVHMCNAAPGAAAPAHFRDDTVCENLMKTVYFCTAILMSIF